MKISVRPVAVTVLCAALVAAQGLNEVAEKDVALRLEGPVPTSRDIAERVLAAFRSGDRETARILASCDPDRFSLAGEIFQMLVRDVVSGNASPQDHLDAVLEFAPGRLPALVEVWKSYGTEQFHAEAALAEVLRKTRTPASRREAEALLAEVEGVHPLIDKLPASLSGTLLLLSEGLALQRLGRSTDALMVLEKASRRAEDHGWIRLQMRCLLGRSGAHLSLTQWDRVLELDRLRLEIAEGTGDRDAILDARMRVAETRRCRGEIAAALDIFRSILQEQIEAGIGDEHRYLLLAAIGTAFEQQSLLPEAIEAYEHALSGARAAGDRRGAGTALLHLSSLRLRMENHDLARAHLDEAKEVLSHRDDTSLRLLMLYEMGRSLEASGKPEDAVRILEQALNEAVATGHMHLLPYIRGALGMLHGQERRLEPALELLRRARTEAQEFGNVVAAAHHLDSIGYVLEAMGRRKEALEAFEAALREFEGLGLRRSAGTCAYNLSVVCMKLGRWAKAAEAARSGLDIMIDASRGLGEVDARDLRAHLRQTTISGVLSARNQLRTLMTRDPASTQRDLFWFIEAGNALLLAEEIINRERLLAARVPPAILAGREAARSRVREVDRRLSEAMEKWTEDPESLRAVQQELALAHRSLEDATARIERAARRTAAVVYPRPIEAKGLQAALPERSALVAYYLSKPLNVAVVVTQEHVRSIDLPRDDELDRPLREMIDEYENLASSSGGSEDELATTLYDALLRPLEKRLREIDRVLLVPDGNQAFLPFEALLRRDGGRSERALERWDFAYVPSGTVFAALIEENRDQPGGEGVLALGDPVYPGESAELILDATAGSESALRGFDRLVRLPHTGLEVREIAELFPASQRQVLVRDSATCAAVRSALASAREHGRLRALHFACHGRVDTEHPRLTGLALAGGQALTLDDIYAIDAPADVTVLSACSTARGLVVQGEGILGLVRGFFHAGCPRVIVSNWPVADDSTRRLMVSFYRHMLAEGRSPAAALREAKRDLLRGGGRTAHPFYWAPFVLWGLID